VPPGGPDPTEGPQAPDEDAGLLRRGTPSGRLTIATLTIGSGIAILDGTVVNIALRRIGTDLEASLAQLQWVSNGYLLSLASLILVGGALGDRLGRRRMYLTGVAGFAVCSALCAFAQSPTQLVAFRILQGVAAALLTPGALAIIQSSFRKEDRAGAIGTWAGMSGIAVALGPFVGGFLVVHAGWRWVFAINLPLCAAVLLLGSRLPESRDEDAPRHFDYRGALSGVLALGASTYLLTSWRQLSTLAIVVGLLVVVAAAWAFIVFEERPGAMAPLSMFRSRVFRAANLMTLLTYGALGAVLFFLVLQLQVTLGWDAIEAGVATLPLPLTMLLLSSRASIIAARTGPRLPLTIGPIVCAVGVVLLSGVDADTSYWTGIYPGTQIFCFGLVMLVSPLTVAVLAAVPGNHAGVASGVNNAVARAGGLLSVAALPAIVGLVGEEYRDPVALTAGYHQSLLICAAMLLIGGVVSWVGLHEVGRLQETGRPPIEERHHA
jgi:EmrB/QacA subfamily drug resistance transporter